MEDPSIFRNSDPILQDSEILRISKPSKRESYSVEKNASELLAWFVTQMKEFVDPKFFATSNFEENMDSLYGRFIEIESWVRGLKSLNRRLISQLDYVKNMLVSMVDAAVSLKFFNTPKDSSHIFVVEMINLNIRQFALRDSFGHLDRTIDGHELFIFYYANFLERTRWISESVKFDSFSVILMLKAQYEIAEINLRELTAEDPRGNRIHKIMA